MAPAGAIVYFEVDDAAVIRLCQQTTEGLQRLADEIEADLVKTADVESASRHITWHADPARDAAVANQWFAHFLARGTQAHGPKEKSVLRFKVDGDYVFAEWVSGITADPFHERAVVAEEARIPDLLNRMLAEAQ